MSELATLDHSALDSLREMVGGDEAFFEEMIDAYFIDAPQLLATMLAAAANGDAEALHRAAHSLKSNSETFGAGPLAEMCRALEQRGRQGMLAGTDILVLHAEAEYERVQRALQAVRSSGTTS